MNIKDLRELDDMELLLREQDVMEDLLTVRFQHHTSQLSSTAKLRQLRREVARIKTVIRQREVDQSIPRGALRNNVDAKELRERSSGFANLRARFGAQSDNKE